MSASTDRPGRKEISEPGPWLAHYTTAATAFEHIVPKGRLRMSPYRLMRDPAENKDLLPAAAAPRGGQHPGREYFAAIQKLKEERDRVRLLSLTSDVHYEPRAKVFGCCWARPRLWEQYADAHRGVCLVFERARLEEALRGRFGAEWVSFGEVEYTPAGIADSAATFLHDQRLLDATTREEAMSEYLSSRRQELFFLKSEDWEAEHEVRAVLMGSDDEYAHTDYGQALVVLVLGEHFPRWQIAGAREVCEKADVALAHVRWLNGQPNLRPA
jgi:DUF2971 family protein